MKFLFCKKQIPRVRRSRIGIYTVLNKSFSPQLPPLILKYTKYFRAQRNCCKKKSDIQNCKALQRERFFCKTMKKSTARLSPAVDFLCSIAGKDTLWSV